ncbi:hypothetical protein PN465_01545 [Nodularia spumigena CS-584]|nr:hypothetical protein [Nodularia spumigena CS-584]
MQTFKLRALMLLFVIALTGCSSDSNSGELCPTLDCQNGGTFENCNCNCPDGFTGSICETEKEPIIITVNKVVVKQFPNSNPAPNIYVVLARQTNSGFSNVYQSQSYYNSATSPGNYPFNVTPGVAIVSTSTPHVISVRNYNSSTNTYTLVGESAFYPYESGEDFPAVKTVNVGNIIADVYLTYQW